ncbi:hypothetical protein B0F90DRAFT_1923650, partial [Multifurca ochricompacta]
PFTVAPSGAYQSPVRGKKLRCKLKLKSHAGLCRRTKWLVCCLLGWNSTIHGSPSTVRASLTSKSTGPFSWRGWETLQQRHYALYRSWRCTHTSLNICTPSVGSGGGASRLKYRARRP